MKKMISDQIDFKKELHKDCYSNGQLAVYVHDNNGEPLAELSIMHDSVELAPNEFVLKYYSENEDLAQELLKSHLIVPTNRFILVGSHLCPICEVGT